MEGTDWNSGYCRFTKDGKLLMVNACLGKISPDVYYLQNKESLEQETDKQFYGYYSASGKQIDLEYIMELRENLTACFYESVGLLSNNGDTLFVKEQLDRKYNVTKTLNRQCVFFEFPK